MCVIFRGVRMFNTVILGIGFINLAATSLYDIKFISFILLSILKFLIWFSTDQMLYLG